MTSTPLVSVLMLTYNHAPYIAQAISSVLGQETEFSLELIICDDASTDGTQDIARNFARKDPRVVLSLQPVNTRFGKNFADGVTLVRGRYVAFCEGDDYWTSTNKLQRQVSFLEANPDFTVCAHKVEILLMEDKQPDTRKEYVYKDCQSDEQRIRDGIFYADEAINNYYFQTGSLVLRWKFPNGLPHWFRQRMMFDHFFFMLHAVDGKIKYFDESMSVWRRHGGGYTWLQTRDKGLFFQKEGDEWIRMYKKMDEFFSYRFTMQIGERILLALRSIASNCMITGNVDQLRPLIEANDKYIDTVLKNAVLLDAIRLAYPERPEFSPPWESTRPVSLEPPRLTVSSDRDNRVSTDKPKDTALPPRNVSVIGGFPPFALDDIPPCTDSVWHLLTEGREYARFFNLRSALLRWLWLRGASTLWLPVYCPPMLEEARSQSQIRRKFYGTGSNLQPSLDFLDEVQPGEAVLTIDYLGRPLSQEFRATLSSRTDVVWVEDKAQSLAPPADGHACIYSPRKIFGVPDGGLLVAPGAKAMEDWCQPCDPDSIHSRQQALCDAFEKPNPALTLRMAKEDMKRQLSRQRMSRLTETMLRRIPVADVARRRRENWACLHRILGNRCLWDIPVPDFTPYAFPLLLPRDYPAEVLHTLLTQQHVQCQRMWYPLNVPVRLFPLEESLSKRLLLLPCDQRYESEDMELIANMVLQILDDPEQALGRGLGITA